MPWRNWAARVALYVAREGPETDTVWLYVGRIDCGGRAKGAGGDALNTRHWDREKRGRGGRVCLRSLGRAGGRAVP